MLSIETKAGDPISAGAVSLVPIARSVCLELGWAALTWTRAIGVTVLPAPGGPARSGGGEITQPIRDRTRQWQLLILGAGLLGSLLLRLAGRRRRAVE